MAKNRPLGIPGTSSTPPPLKAAPREGFQSVHMTPEDFARAVDDRVRALWPDLVRDLLEAMVQRLAGEGRAAAAAAIAEPTDELTLQALADYCEEKQLPELAARVRRLRLEEGDVIVVQPSTPLTSQAMANIRTALDGWLVALESRGTKITGLVVPYGLDLHAFRLKGN